MRGLSTFVPIRNDHRHKVALSAGDPVVFGIDVAAPELAQTSRTPPLRTLAINEVLELMAYVRICAKPTRKAS